MTSCTSHIFIEIEYQLAIEAIFLATNFSPAGLHRSHERLHSFGIVSI